MTSELHRLRDRVEELEELLGINQSFTDQLSSKFKLSRVLAKTLGILMSRNLVSPDGLYAALYGDRLECNRPTGAAVSRKHIHFLRKKLDPYGIKIEAIYGRGWQMRPEQKEAVKQMFRQQQLEAA